LAALALAFDSYLEIMDRRDQRVEAVKSRMLLVADNLAHQQYEFAAASRMLLNTLTKLAPSVDACGQDFKDLATGSRWLKAISIADKNGMLVCSSGPLKPNTSVADRGYFKEVMNTRGFVLSDYVVG